MFFIGFALLLIIMRIDNKYCRGKDRIAEGAELGELVEYAIEDNFAGFEMSVRIRKGRKRSR